MTEVEFQTVLKAKLSNIKKVNSVTGPGRSGAIAAVYSSYLLGVPFIPYGTQIPKELSPILIIDTARKSGKTMRKAESEYCYMPEIISVWCFDEPPRVKFWYENIR